QCHPAAIGSTKSSSTATALWRSVPGGETRVLSRNQKDLGGKFTEVKDSIAALDEKGRSSFQLLQSFDMGPERPPIVFYAFDLIQLNGKNLRNLPIEEPKNGRQSWKN